MDDLALHKLTIVIISYNRHKYLKRTISYWQNYNAKVVVLDGSDNFDTRYLANRTAVALGIPLISGALSQWEGQLSVFDPKTDGPCYQCIFPEAPAEGLAPSCAEAGVFAPLPGVIGAMMAAEAMKLITKAGAPLRGELLIYDALYGESRRLKAPRRTACPICDSSAAS